MSPFQIYQYLLKEASGKKTLKFYENYFDVSKAAGTERATRYRTLLASPEFKRREKNAQHRVVKAYWDWVFGHNGQLTDCIYELQALEVPSQSLQGKDALLQKYREMLYERIPDKPEKLVKQLEDKEASARAPKANARLSDAKSAFRRLFDMYWVRLEDVVEGNGADEGLKERILKLKQKRFNEHATARKDKHQRKQGPSTSQPEQQQQGTGKASEEERNGGGGGMDKGFFDPGEDKGIIIPSDASYLDETPELGVGDTGHFDSLFEDWLNACGPDRDSD